MFRMHECAHICSIAFRLAGSFTTEVYNQDMVCCGCGSDMPRQLNKIMGERVSLHEMQDALRNPDS